MPLHNIAMESLYNSLRINEVKFKAAFSTYLDGLLHTTGKGEFILGLSGGIDSALLATALVKHYGSESVHGVYLYDRDSSSRLAFYARSLADELGISHLTRSIEPEMKARGIYDPLPMRITRQWAVLNRVLYRMYTLLAGEPPFVTTLRVGGGEIDDSDSRHKLYRRVFRVAEQAFNARHIFRRRILEENASVVDAIPLGAANRSEWKIGWFVKGGVDDMAHQPLKGLYKTQIRQLAEYYELPKQIRTQKPSPDMRKGITDEFAIGMPYDEVDVLLDYLEGGIDYKIIKEQGFRVSKLARVREMNQLSAWKRDVDLETFPIDGGPGSELRIQEYYLVPSRYLHGSSTGP